MFMHGTIGAVLLATLRRQLARYLKEHLLSHAIVNAYLSGVVSHQFYVYWCRGEFNYHSRMSFVPHTETGFEDSKRIK
jgi:hypothetical protein